MAMPQKMTMDKFFHELQVLLLLVLCSAEKEKEELTRVFENARTYRAQKGESSMKAKENPLKCVLCCCSTKIEQSQSSPRRWLC
ncbi:hypothetical protein U1Q18_010304, partial [Sarracenia purpurea var. burkii]